MRTKSVDQGNVLLGIMREGTDLRQPTWGLVLMAIFFHAIYEIEVRSQRRLIVAP